MLIINLHQACLNTYLRNAKPPVFSSRTCRMSSIIDHRHPLQDPSQPPHPTKNRPDKTKKADEALGRKFVQDLGIANARDIVKMIRWNERYGIKFMRLSSEMFPFASHDVHGYKLAPFASEVLAEAGKVIGELGHRVTMHPGQFTQLGSPRKEVIIAAVRDLEYHDELLSLLKLPPQQDRDAVLILHMGGVYGDKASALARFKESYTTLLSPSIKNRLVLENDDVSWSVHDLLPVCEELNIPLVLDWHHHNIVFDAEHVREGTLDISAPELQERIRRTWTRKNITQKQHYSEPEPGAVTGRDRRKHSPRVASLPPCFADMDLMIEAKDKEQAVFELMRNFRLPGFEKANMVIPHEREDEDKPLPRVAKKNGTPKKSSKAKKRKIDAEDAQDILLDAGDDGVPGGMVETAGPDGEVESFPAGPPAPATIPPEELGMGGPLGRVYWPPGMEEWLRPKKREVKEKVKKEEVNEGDGEVV
jgi:UV DNA damage endonuclease